MDPQRKCSTIPANFTFDPANHRIISFSCVRDSDGDYSAESGSDAESENDDERLASLEALRYALHHAPFCKSGHTLMSIPDECSLQMQGIPTKCAIRLEAVSYRGILENINMEVPKGKIYALLGCANSGKSTLLKCIIGRLRPTAGCVTTFGTSPTKSPLSAICVGFMPQEVTLHPELTVGETLHHYGRLYQLPAYLIEERIADLSTMLHLPGGGVYVKNCNPGQKWRISLAVTLIHSPPLLLLDEPTVMVDPLIRWSVWNRLERLCDEEGLTVLITTKYPEEIGFAYKAGLIRDGHIYVEDRPEELRQRYSCSTYDQLYQKFCEVNAPRHLRPSIAPYLTGSTASLRQTELTSTNSSATLRASKVASSRPAAAVIVTSESDDRLSEHHHQSRNGPSLASCLSTSAPQSLLNPMFPLLKPISDLESARRLSARSTAWSLPMAEWPICERRRTAYLSRFINLDLKRLLALVTKNLYIIRGNLLSIAIFYFLFPAVQIVFMCAIFGRTIRHIPVSIPADLALKDNFGPTFVHGYFDEHIFSPSYVPDLPTALAQVTKGHAYAAIVPWTARATSSSQVNVSSSSSQAISNVICDGEVPEKGLQAQAQIPFGIKLYIDQSNYVIGQTMFYSFLSSMRHFVKSDSSRIIMEAIRKSHDCPPAPVSPWWNHSAIDIAEVIYGSTRFRFLEFLLPGFLCAIVFSYSLVLSAYLFIKEQLAGLQDRCLTTGTSGIEVLAAHYLSQTALYILQQTMILVIVFRLFGLPARGPFYSLWLLIFLQGLAGISFGLFIAVICPKPISAALVTSAIFIPAFFISGIIWPIESQHRLAQHLSHALPLTLPINSLRYILSRGPDMHYSQILLGYSISAGYIAILLLFTVAIFKCKTSS